ncbi:glycosyltransferase [Nocardiopsis sp. CA-288880]|uniref:glycosyltransferase n=1 Tax=Nocardiopsis sp. CA-288880 TaxID=3239995 RepID=UPI003D9560ED
MITSAISQALRTRGDERAVLCRIGAGGGVLDELASLRLRPDDLLLDLGTHPVGEPVLPGGGTGGDGGRPAVGLVAVVAASLTDLRRAVTLAAHLPRAVHLLVAVAHIPGHHGGLAPSPPGIEEWNDLHELRVRRAEKGGWVCELFFPSGTDVAPALAAVFHGGRGRRRGPGSGIRAGLHGPQAHLWSPGDPEATPVGPAGPVPLIRVTPAADLVLRTEEGSSLPLWEDVAVPALDRSTTGADSWESRVDTDGPAAALRVRGPDPVSAVAPIDERLVNPMGFNKRTKGPVADLTVDGSRAVIRTDGDVLVTVPADGGLTDVDLDRIRDLRVVRVDWSGHTGPAAAVRAVASLAAGGVPLVSGPVPAWAAGLGQPLTDLLTSVEEEDMLDGLAREEHSIRLRRAALRAHGRRTRWRALAEEAGIPVVPDPLVSVVLCTRRPDLVGFALAQVARQRHVRFEVVLALHGFSASLPPVEEAVRGFSALGHAITVHEADGDKVFGAVMNEAVDRASGTVIAKWDDDDWYGPEHLSDLMLSRSYSGADVVGISQNFAYLQELDLTVWRSYRSEFPNAQVVGSTILTDRVVLEDVGGFRPLPRAIDSQFLLAVRQAGGRIYRTHGLGYLLRRAGAGHTWEVDLGYFLRNHTKQWSGWRPNSLMEGEAEPLGRAAPHTEHSGGHS